MSLRRKGTRGRLIAHLTLQGWYPATYTSFTKVRQCWSHKEHGSWRLDVAKGQLVEIVPPLRTIPANDWSATTMPTLRRLRRLHVDMEQLAEASA